MDDPQYLKYRAWRAEAGRLCRVAAEPPAASGLPALVDVAGIRRRLGQLMGGQPISQAAFARRYGFSPAAVRDWEQGRRRPSVSARVLLLAINRDPHLVDVAIEAAIDGDHSRRNLPRHPADAPTGFPRNTRPRLRAWRCGNAVVAQAGASASHTIRTP